MSARQYPTIAVVAGSRVEFTRWALDHPEVAGKRLQHDRWEHVFYAHDDYSIEGRDVTEVRRIGTWSTRPARQLQRLEDELRLALRCTPPRKES